MNEYPIALIKLSPEEVRHLGDVRDKLVQSLEPEFFLLRREERRSILSAIISESFSSFDDRTKTLIIDDVAGFGRFEPLFTDPDLEEIMINGINKPVFVFHRENGMCKTDCEVGDKNEMDMLIARIERFAGRKVPVDFPLYDATLPDGQRVNITLPPASPMPTITVRTTHPTPLTIIELIDNGSLTAEAAAFLWTCTDGFGLAHMNMIVCGGTGSGKTTLVNALALLVPQKERIVTIEDTLELNLADHDNWVRLNTATIGREEVNVEDLVKHCLRMRPDRVIVGEVRGEEAIQLAVAMDLGMTAMGTLHANDASETLLRLRSPPMNVPLPLLSLLDVIVVTKRFYQNGQFHRKLVGISEVGRIEGDRVLLGEAFKWNPTNGKLEMKSFPVLIRDSLAAETGKDPKEIMKEFKTRQHLLSWMQKNNLKDWEAISQVIDIYYTDPRALMRKIGLQKDRSA